VPTSGASTDRTCLKCRHWAKLVAQAGRYSNHLDQLGKRLNGGIAVPAVTLAASGTLRFAEARTAPRGELYVG